MSHSPFFDLFEYLCDGSMAIINIFNLYSAGIDFSRQKLMSVILVVRFWRLKSIPAL